MFKYILLILMLTSCTITQTSTPVPNKNLGQPLYKYDQKVLIRHSPYNSFYNNCVGELYDVMCYNTLGCLYKVAYKCDKVTFIIENVKESNLIIINE